MRAAERDGSQQHQADDSLGVVGSDDFGDLGAHALADDDHHGVDRVEHLAGLSGKGFQRHRVRIGDRSGTRAESG